MSPARLAAICCVTTLVSVFSAACAPDKLTSPTDLSPNFDISASDPRGELIVEVKYGGAFHDAAAPNADNDCQILVNVGVPTWSGNAVRFCEKTRTTVVSPGTFGSSVWMYDGYQYPTLSQNIPVTVTAGQTTRQVYNLETMTGVVSGSITVDGVPAKSPYKVCLTTGGCSYFPRGDGTFSLITKPGAGTGVVTNNLGTQIGTFSYSASLGTTVSLPGQNVSDPRGDLVVEVRYNGRFYDPQSPTADNDCQILVNVGVPSWSGNAVRYCERTRTTTVVPGTYSSSPWIYDGYQYPTLVANIPIEVVNGQTTTQVYEIATMTGIVSGRVTLDGQPAANTVSVCLSTGGCSSFPRGDGTFKLLTKPGTGTGVVRNNTGVTLGSFTYAAVQGQTVVVADQAISDPKGDLTVEVRYNGQFFNPSAPIADNDCQMLVNVGVPTWSGNAVRSCERTRSTRIAPGTYYSNVWMYDGYMYPTITGNIPVTVVQGQLTTQVYELASVTSILTGKVMIDGQPASSSYRVCLSTGGCSNFPRGDGTFKLITKPGAGTGAVWNNIGVRLVTFNYNSVAGETEPIGTIGGDNTPPEIVPSLTGTAGSAGWYTTAVRLTWSVTDGQSAVQERAGCDPVSVAGDTPGSTYTCTASSAGGSASKSVTIKLDATKPTITFSGNAGEYGVDRTISISCAAADAMSGIASQTCEDVSRDAYLYLPGSHTVAATAMDRAGNSRTANTTFVVTVSYASLGNLVARLVTHAGLANSLQSKLSAASSAATRGNAAAARGSLEAFQNQLQAQAGKGVSSAHADVLMRLADSL